MLCKVLPGEIFPWFVRFWNAGTCFKFWVLFPGVNNAVTVNSFLVCEEGFEIWPFLQGFLFFFIFEFRVLTIVFRLRKFTSAGVCCGVSFGGVPRVCLFLVCWEVLKLVSK